MLPFQMRPGEAAALLGVSVPTIHRLAASGKLGYWRTPGGHRRFDRSEVELLRAVMRGQAGDEPEAGSC